MFSRLALLFLLATGCVTATDTVIMDAKNQGKFPATCSEGAACFALGMIASDREDLALQQRFFRRGCELKHEESCMEKARLSFEEGDAAGAIKEVRAACENRKVGFGCFHWALMEEKLGNRLRAKELSIRACQLGIGLSCELVLNYLEDDATGERFSYLDKARVIFRKLCDNGNNEGCDSLQELTTLESVEKLFAVLTFLEKGCKNQQEQECKQLKYLQFLTLTCQRQNDDNAKECQILIDNAENLFKKHFKEILKRHFDA